MLFDNRINKRKHDENKLRYVIFEKINLLT